MAHGLDYDTAAAILLTGLTAYEAITEELKAKSGESLFIPGGSGSFGQMSVPILSVVVFGNKWAKETITALEAERYIVYTEENYEEVLPPLDYVIGKGVIKRTLYSKKRRKVSGSRKIIPEAICRPQGRYIIQLEHNHR